MIKTKEKTNIFNIDKTTLEILNKTIQNIKIIKDNSTFNKSKILILIESDFIYFMNNYFSLKVKNDFHTLEFKESYFIELEIKTFFININQLSFDTSLNLNNIYIDMKLIQCLDNKVIDSFINNRLTINNKENKTRKVNIANFEINNHKKNFIKKAFQNSYCENLKNGILKIELKNNIQLIISENFNLDLDIETILKDYKN